MVRVYCLDKACLVTHVRHGLLNEASSSYGYHVKHAGREAKLDVIHKRSIIFKL